MKLILALSMFVSSAAFADIWRPASIKEHVLLCDAVKKMTEENYTEMILNYNLCKRDLKIRSRLVSEGAREVAGRLRFNAFARPSFDLKCSLTYFGKPTIENIIPDLNTGVSCK